MKQYSKKLIRIVLAALALVLVGTILISGIMVYSGRKHIISAGEAKNACIIVLGCSVNPDRSPSSMLKDRLDRTIEVYQNSGAKIIVSGDHLSDDYNEVAAMKDYLIAAGIPSEDIYEDHAGYSTYDSVYRARKVFDVDEVTIVTQEYHLYRAMYIAEAIGIKTEGVVAEGDNYRGQIFRDVREVFARDKDFLWCMFWPRGAEADIRVSLSYSGDTTNEKPTRQTEAEE